MQILHRLWRYWFQIAASSKGAYNMIRCFLFFLAAMVAIISRLPLKYPVPILTDPITQACSMWGAIALLAYILFWLPFREHERITVELEALKRAVGQGLIIHSAKYGDGSEQRDVTQRIAARISLPPVRVDLQLTGCDPKPLTIKTLTVIYSFQGKQHTCRVEENETLELPHSATISWYTTRKVVNV